MSGLPSRALGRLIRSDVTFDKSGLDDRGTRPMAKWWSFPRCALRFAMCHDLLWDRELTSTECKRKNSKREEELLCVVSECRGMYL